MTGDVSVSETMWVDKNENIFGTVLDTGLWRWWVLGTSFRKTLVCRRIKSLTFFSVHVLVKCISKGFKNHK